MKAFPSNLKKARSALGFTQEKAAHLLNIKIRTYQAYEEGRAEPRAGCLMAILRVFAITNADGFYSNPDFQWSDQGQQMAENRATEEYASKRGPYQPRAAIWGS